MRKDDKVRFKADAEFWDTLEIHMLESLRDRRVVGSVIHYSGTTCKVRMDDLIYYFPSELLELVPDGE